MEAETGLGPLQCRTVAEVRRVLTAADCSKSRAVLVLSPELARVVGRYLNMEKAEALCRDMKKVEVLCLDHLARAERYRRKARRAVRIMWVISAGALAIAIAASAGAI